MNSGPIDAEPFWMKLEPVASKHFLQQILNLMLPLKHKKTFFQIYYSTKVLLWI